MRHASATFFLVLFSLGACASSDELAGEADVDDGGDGKADTPNGASTYYAIEQDDERGVFKLRRLNASQTRCHDGTRKAVCETPELDWSRSNLGRQAQVELEDADILTEDDAIYAIVRGRFAATGTGADPERGRFIVTEAWVAEGDGVADGVFAKVFDNGSQCFVGPCAHFTERALNSSREATISAIDFERGDFLDDDVARFIGDTSQPGGLIIAGDRYTYSLQGRSGRGRTATNVYRNLANRFAGSSGLCYRGGCSGQLCTDRPNAISTCEFRPEYACYAAATCERQADGECGWTQTTELQACLGTD
jgi:hypothetical protein